MDIETVVRILDQSVETYQPSTIIASYSGGYDSMVMAHIVNAWACDRARSVPVIVIPVDTGISADGWRDFVTESAQQVGAQNFEIWANNVDKWREDVMDRGFVYRKAQHPFYFYYLKQRVFRSQVAHFKTGVHDRVMFVDGVRRAESADRQRTPEHERRGSGVFVHPLVYCTDQDVHAYRTDADLPTNPFYDRTHNSGDCLCNWHNRISVSDIERWGTHAWEVIAPLHQHNLEVFGYGYDGEPSESLKQEQAGQQRLFDWDTDCTPNLCAGCNKPNPTNDAVDFVTLQRMDW